MTHSLVDSPNPSSASSSGQPSLASAARELVDVGSGHARSHVPERRHLALEHEDRPARHLDDAVALGELVTADVKTPVTVEAFSDANPVTVVERPGLTVPRVTTRDDSTQNSTGAVMSDASGAADGHGQHQGQHHAGHGLAAE